MYHPRRSTREHTSLIRKPASKCGNVTLVVVVVAAQANAAERIE
jgi:hypothetical protein